MPRPKSAPLNGEVIVYNLAQLPQLLNRAELLAKASDSLRDLVVSDVESNIATSRFDHPFASIASRVEREATKTARTYKAAKKAAESAAAQPPLADSAP